MFDDDEIDLSNPHDRWRVEVVLAEIDRAIGMAEVRLQPTKELVENLSRILDDPAWGRILYRLEEVQLTPEEADRLAEQVEALSESWEKLPSREKTRADGVLWRLLRALPEPHQSRIALRFLVHRRKRRRDAAYKILSKRDIPATLLDDLLVLYETSGDEQFLQLIARNPKLVALADEHYLLEEIVTPYWQMRIIQGLLVEAPSRALPLASKHARRFVYAVGRLQASQHLPVLRRLFHENRGDTRFLGIYAWALGRMGDIPALNEVREAIVELRDRLDEPGA